MPAPKLTKHQAFTMERMLRSTIKEHPQNPRRIGEGAKKKLRAKMKDVGLVQPIIVNRTTGFLLGGHQRLSTLDALEKYDAATHANDYELDVAVCVLDQQKELEMLVFLNNPSSQGTWDLEGLANLSLDLGVSLTDGMGFDKVDVELMFDGDARFGGLFGDDAKTKDDKEATRQIKEDGKQAKSKSGLDEFREKGGRDISSDFYVVIVCENAEQKAQVMKHLRLPKGEQYISPHEVLALKRPD